MYVREMEQKHEFLFSMNETLGLGVSCVSLFSDSAIEKLMNFS